MHCSFLYNRGLEDLVVGSRKRKWFEAGKLGLGQYCIGKMQTRLKPILAKHQFLVVSYPILS